MRLTAFATSRILTGCAAAISSPVRPRPNIVFILVDDLREFGQDAGGFVSDVKELHQVSTLGETVTTALDNPAAMLRACSKSIKGGSKTSSALGREACGTRARRRSGPMRDGPAPLMADGAGADP